MEMYGIVMAGGGGTRLWPKSRENFPKQIHPLVGEKPLVQAMTDRLSAILGEDKVYIITNAHHVDLICEATARKPDVVFIDPYRRDTAPCIGLAAAYISLIDPEAILGVFPSDHYISGDEEFAQTILAAKKLAEMGKVVTIGIPPTAPETGYGYIQIEPEYEVIKGCEVHKAKRFVEKPDLPTAKRYVESGDYLWNSGMFVWSVPKIMELFALHLPDIHERLMRIKDAVGGENETDVLHREYEAMRRISVDYGIMEKLDDIMVVRATFGWNDIGSWTAVSDIMPKDEYGNAVNAFHIGVDTTNNLVVGSEDKLIATIGLDDMIIVDTEDALLVCPKDRAQDVKKLVELLKERGLEKYL
ncbi:MAG: NTP transferase domain-containing protein [Armatimonadetes bacterium]|nr:NTP transferase domain-containing protein [Armatimonadota bacterium]